MDHTLMTVDRAAALFAEARTALAASVQALDDSIKAAKRAHMAEIKRLAARLGERHFALEEEIRHTPDAFVKPRTLVLHGIRCGWQKQKGTIEFEDSERVLALIRKHLPEQEDILIRTKEEPDKTAIGKLPVDQMRRIGVTLTDAGDEIVIKAVDSDVTKLVDAYVEELNEIKE